MRKFVVILAILMVSLIAARGGEEPVYEPVDLKDAVLTLEQELTTDKAESLVSPSNTRIAGIQLLNHWNLSRNSRFSQYFREKGIYNPELMVEIVFEALRMMKKGKSVDVAALCRKTLTSYSLGANVPSDIWKSAPDEVRSLFLLFFVQLDDTSIVHVFCASDKEPKWVYHHTWGWQKADAHTLQLIQSKRSISVKQQYDPEDKKLHSLEAWFDLGRGLAP